MRESEGRGHDAVDHVATRLLRVVVGLIRRPDVAVVFLKRLRLIEASLRWELGLDLVLRINGGNAEREEGRMPIIFNFCLFTRRKLRLPKISSFMCGRRRYLELPHHSLSIPSFPAARSPKEEGQ